jgi:probable rRNA maturation factor
MFEIEMNQELVEEHERLSSTLLDAISKSVQELTPEVTDGILAASFISDEEMQELNKKYRQKDSTTDVLSFSYISKEDTGETLGDVVISLEQARQQAKNHSLKDEVITLLVHGILHVFGYDHENETDAEKMLPLQDKIVSNLK